MLNIGSLSRFAPITLRVVLGIIFLIHGYMKIGHIAHTVKSFTTIGIPLPTVAAPFVTFLELVGGIALILGIGSRIFALLLAIEMGVAIVTAKAHAGFIGGWEFELVLIAGLVTLFLGGPGAVSLIRKKESIVA